MLYGVLADLIVLLHFGFLAFVVLGGMLVLRRPWVAWVHVPAALWGAVIEFAGWICPLTPLENHLRGLAGEAAYSGSFIERYLLPLVYPTRLTRELQIVLGVAVLAINAGLYGALVARRRAAARKPGR
jgi:uncharacterized protein DUF2784